MKTKLKALIASLLVVLTIGSVAAMIYYTMDVPSFVHVTGAEIELWNEAKTAVVTSFDFTSLMQGESYAEIIYVKNIGDLTVWVAWECTDLPAGLTLVAHAWNGADWADVPQLNYNMFSTGVGIAPGAFSERSLRFTLTVDSAPRGDYTFTILLHAANSASG